MLALSGSTHFTCAVNSTIIVAGSPRTAGESGHWSLRQNEDSWPSEHSVFRSPAVIISPTR